MRRGDGDVARLVRQRTGVTTPGDLRQIVEQGTRYRRDPETPGSEYGRPVQLPPGFFAADTTSLTALTSNRTFARYLGQAPDDLNLVTLRFSVQTAASGITWAEVGIATSLDMIFGNNDLIPNGYVDVSATFNSTGTKDVEVPVTISRDEHVWALFGSQATTPFQVSRGIGDALTTGMIAFADVQPSTMSNPTTFAASGATGNAAWVAFIM